MTGQFDRRQVLGTGAAVIASVALGISITRAHAAKIFKAPALPDVIAVSDKPFHFFEADGEVFELSYRMFHGLTLPTRS